MPVVNIVVIVVSVAVAVGAVGWMLTTRKHPENAATHSDGGPSTTSDELYKGADRPAGPDAEVMNPNLLGGDHRPPTTSTPEADAHPDTDRDR